MTALPDDAVVDPLLAVDAEHGVDDPPSPRPRWLQFTLTPGVVRFLRFGLVGASGLLVNVAVLDVLLRLLPAQRSLGVQSAAAVLATQTAIVWNFVLTKRAVFADRPGDWRRRFLPFVALNNVALLLQLPLSALIAQSFGLDYLLTTTPVILALSVGRFVACDALIFAGPRRSTYPGAGRKAAR